MNKPLLIEPTTRYYLQEKLKQCHTTRANIYFFILNISVVILFFGCFFYILYTMYVQRLTPEQQYEKNQIEQHIIMNKIHQLRTIPPKVNALVEHNVYSKF